MVNQVERYYSRGRTGGLPDEYLEYLLIKQLYHCPPSQLDLEDPAILQMHMNFIRIDHEQEQLNQRRQEQYRKNSK